MQFNEVNNKERSVIMWSAGICLVKEHWIRQYVLSSLQGFASHLAILECGCVCLYLADLQASLFAAFMTEFTGIG